MPYRPSEYSRVACLNTLGPGNPRVVIRSLGAQVYINVAGADWTSRRLRAAVPELRGWHICLAKAYRKALTLTYPDARAAKVGVLRVRKVIKTRLEQEA
ncbi:MAG TPA: hypothetical protein VN436_03140 [Holophaga sp.]|nr:hypothetical protein [Holophaga sp.]